MKPVLFKNQNDLLRFIDSLPAPEGYAKVMGQRLETKTILNRCAHLVPKIFEYRQLLAKGARGLGSQNAVMRYAEVAADNVSMEKIEAYQEALSVIEMEAEALFEVGLSEEMIQQVMSAKNKLNAFKMMKESIEGFRSKLKKYMDRVDEAYSDLNSEMRRQKRQLSQAMDPQALTLLSQEVDNKHQAVKELASALDEYCALQIGYNGILIGAI